MLEFRSDCSQQFTSREGERIEQRKREGEKARGWMKEHDARAKKTEREFRTRERERERNGCARVVSLESRGFL